MCTSAASCLLALALLAGTANATLSLGVGLSAGTAGTSIRISDGRVVHMTAGQVSAARVVQAEGLTIVLWEEVGASGAGSFYAVAEGGGAFSRALVNSTTIEHVYASFDPAMGVPAVPAALQAHGVDGGGAYMVQTVIPLWPALRARLEAMGVGIHQTLHHNGFVATMDAGTAAAVANLPFVRWVGVNHPAFKLERALSGPIEAGLALPTQAYSIMLVAQGQGAMGQMSGLARLIGAPVSLESPQTGRLEATLTRAQLLALAQSPLVLFIDRRGVDGVDMDIQRQLSGADYIEAQAGYNGSGVRGEVMDSELRETHLFFQNPGLGGLNTTLPPIKRPFGSAQSSNHGTPVYSTVFADGNPTPAARGHMPHAQGYFLYNNSIDGVNTRYALTQGTVANECIFQTNSWGTGFSTDYTTFSAEMDTIIFDLDISILQAQSNTGHTGSRPQAWAKNVVAVGGFLHHNTPTRADDCWCDTASIGPASDGRIKPDLANFYDQTMAASALTNSTTTAFGGTSNATPSTAGALGLIYEMWADGLFGNQVGGGSVFAERPHAMTVKALAINTAFQYDWLAGGPNGDMTRVRQGWGMINVRNLFDTRGNMFVVNEGDEIVQAQTATYGADVATGTGALKVTMAYRDPPGNPANQAMHRINDLTLKVTAPDGVTVYWGNNGALAGLWTPSGGTADLKNTVENVFVQNPAAGEWTIEVQGNSITTDAVPGTVGVIDASFALVVTGALPADGGCQPDVTTGAVPGQAGYGVPNGVLNNDDFFYYLAQFAAGNPVVADMTTTAVVGSPGYGVPNGVINNDDFFYYLAAFAAGC